MMKPLIQVGMPFLSFLRLKSNSITRLRKHVVMSLPFACNLNRAILYLMLCVIKTLVSRYYDEDCDEEEHMADHVTDILGENDITFLWATGFFCGVHIPNF